MTSAKHTKTYTLEELAKHTQGQLQGNPKTSITGVCALDEQVASCISFIRDGSLPNLDKLIEDWVAAAFFCTPNLQVPSIHTAKLNLIRVKDPYAALISIIPLFREESRMGSGISPKADIDPSAKIGKNVSIAAFTAVGAGCSIGDNSVVFPNVTIYPNVGIGQNCVIHAGAVIREDTQISDNVIIQGGAIVGSEGFGYVPDSALGLKAIPQIGSVKLAERVEIGANACIDRATLGSTKIGHGSKLDNLVQVGHNVKIGKHAILCGQAGVAGSTTIGDQVVLGGSSGVADHVEIASGVRIAGQAGVVGHLRERGDYAGYPAVPAKRWRRMMVALEKLPDLLRQFRRLEGNSDEE